MKVYEPNTVRIEIEEEEMKILKKAYTILDELSSRLEYFEDKKVEYLPFGTNENDFYDLLTDMKGYISEVTDDW